MNQWKRVKDELFLLLLPQKYKSTVRGVGHKIHMRGGIIHSGILKLGKGLQKPLKLSQFPFWCIWITSSFLRFAVPLGYLMQIAFSVREITSGFSGALGSPHPYFLPLSSLKMNSKKSLHYSSLYTSHCFLAFFLYNVFSTTMFHVSISNHKIIQMTMK